MFRNLGVEGSWRDGHPQPIPLSGWPGPCPTVVVHSAVIGGWLTEPSGLSRRLVSLSYFQGSGMDRYPPVPTHAKRTRSLCSAAPVLLWSSAPSGRCSVTSLRVSGRCRSSSKASCTLSLPGGPPTPPSLPQLLARLGELYKSGTSDIWESNRSWLIAGSIASACGRHRDGWREEEKAVMFFSVSLLPASGLGDSRGILGSRESRWGLLGTWWCP